MEYPARLRCSEPEYVGEFTYDGSIEDGARRGSALVIYEIKIIGRGMEEIEPKIAAYVLGIAVALNQRIEKMRCAEGISEACADEAGDEVPSRQVHVVMAPSQPCCEFVSGSKVACDEV